MSLHPWLVLALLAATGPAAASTDPHPSLIEVRLASPPQVEQVLEGGFDVVSAKGDRLRLLAWPEDCARLAASGFAVSVLDADPGATATARSRAELERLGRAWRVPRLRVGRVVQHPIFGQGSMGGFWTADEVKSFLDSLVADDPNDLVADKLDTLGYSRRGRPVLGLLLGKQDAGLASRPAALFTGLIHAREPEGMQALLYFAHRLLSRYGSDPEATYLLDHRRLYLCPVVNPDGYALNESLFVARGTFGYWRKNLRDNDGDGVFDYPGDGVDLNRNFGYQWGIDDVGSSPTPSSEAYRGPGPFSEPETQAQRAMVDSLKPVTGLAFHTYGDYFLFPWGYTAAATPDSLDFFDWSLDATLGSHFQLGQAPRTLYRVNGDHNDWCYGEVAEKPRSYSWTPEVGNDGDDFWAPPSRILPLAELCVRPSQVIAYAAGAWVRVRDVEHPEGPLWPGGIAKLRVLVRNKGIGASTGSGLAASLLSLSAGVHVTSGPVDYPDLPPRTDGAPSGDGLFTVTADDSVTAGRKARLQVEFTTPAGFFSRDTIETVVGIPTVVFSDDAESGIGDWWSGLWGIVNGDAWHPSLHFTDSPVNSYGANANNAMTLRSRLDLSAGVHAYAEFVTRWTFEQDYDCALVEASLDSVTWAPLPGRFTKPGSGVPGSTQPAGLPVYDGINYLWRPERVDLSAVSGPAATTVRLRFRVRSDAGKHFDGFRFDDLRVVTYDPAAQPPAVAVTADPAPTALALAAPRPNPARSGARFVFQLPAGAGPVTLELLDLQGRRVRMLASGALAPGRHDVRWDGTDQSGRSLPGGIYFARLSTGGRGEVRRFAVLR
jgi:hypothetical protein